MTELELQAQVADYIRLQYPDVIFHSDFGSGIKLTMGQAIKQKRLNGGRRSWPDMFLAEPKGKYAGLMIELKKEGVRVYKKDGTLVSDEHIREQYDMLEQLRRRGYAANFACGFDEAKALIDRYMRCAD
jgi:hypothetical protein